MNSAIAVLEKMKTECESDLKATYQPAEYYNRLEAKISVLEEAIDNLRSEKDEPPKEPNKLQERVDAFNAKNLFNKNMILGHAERYGEILSNEKEVLANIYEGNRKFCNVIFITEGYAIVKSSEKSYEQYPYRALFKDGEKWIKSSAVWPTIEYAILDALGTKFEGPNTRFAMYAAKMLDMQKVE